MRGQKIGFKHSEKTKRVLSELKKGKPCGFIKTKFNKGNIPWNKGLTKENDIRLKKASEVRSKSLKGNIPWNKGLTMKTDERIKGIRMFNHEQAKEIINLYGKNSITQIAKEFNCSPTTIYSILKENNVEIKGAKYFNKGKKQSEETITKRSLHLIGRKPSEKMIARLIKMNLTDNPSKRPEVRAKLKITRTKQILPSKDTEIEVKIQNFLKQLGIEFYTHQYIKEIEHGYQCDILIPSMRMVIECDGDYWHKYPIGREIDHIRTSELLQNGFKVLRLWECEINELDINGFRQKIVGLK